MLKSISAIKHVIHDGTPNKMYDSASSRPDCVTMPHMSKYTAIPANIINGITHFLTESIFQPYHPPISAPEIGNRNMKVITIAKIAYPVSVEFIAISIKITLTSMAKTENNTGQCFFIIIITSPSVFSGSKFIC